MIRCDNCERVVPGHTPFLLELYCRQGNALWSRKGERPAEPTKTVIEGKLHLCRECRSSYGREWLALLIKYCSAKSDSPEFTNASYEDNVILVSEDQEDSADAMAAPV